MKKSIQISIFSAIGFFLLTQISLAWTGAKRLTYTSGSSISPVLVCDVFDTLHVLYQDNTPGNNEIFYKQSTDGGLTWANQRLTWNSSETIRPVMKVTSGVYFPGGIKIYLYMMWSSGPPGNEEVYYKRSLNGGITWIPTKRITWNSGESLASEIALWALDTVHIVWTDFTPGNAEIFYKKSTNNGTSWGPAKRITWNPGNSMDAKIAIDSSANLHIVWWDFSLGNWEIYYKKSTNGGDTWSAPLRLTWNSGNSMSPQITVETNDHLHVVWYDDTPGNFEVFYKKSTDGGTTWSPPQRMAWNSGASMNPVITTINSGIIHVAWDDNTPGNWEIFYKKSTDGGTIWSTPQRITWTSALSWHPSISSDIGNKIHIVWNDLRSGNWDIYYKRDN